MYEYLEILKSKSVCTDAGSIEHRFKSGTEAMGIQTCLLVPVPGAAMAAPAGTWRSSSGTMALPT